MKSFAYCAANIVAQVLAAAVAASRPATRPFMRLCHVAGLRSQVRGTVPVTTQFDGPVYTAAANTRLDLGPYCRLGRGVFFETPGAGAIQIGQHVRINAGTHIVASRQVRIGDHCLIGEYVSIRDANHGTEAGGLMRRQPETSAPIRIGDDVWIGRGTVVLKGVTIGRGAVVGANSVVTKDVAEYTIVAGIPARPIRKRAD